MSFRNWNSNSQLIKVGQNPTYVLTLFSCEPTFMALQDQKLPEMMPKKWFEFFALDIELHFPSKKVEEI